MTKQVPLILSEHYPYRNARGAAVQFHAAQRRAEAEKRKRNQIRALSKPTSGGVWIVLHDWRARSTPVPGKRIVRRRANTASGRKAIRHGW